MRQARGNSRLFQEYFTLQICTSGKKRTEATSNKPTGRAATTDDDGDKKRKQTLDAELGQIKKLRVELQTELRQSRNSQFQNAQSSNPQPFSGGKPAGKQDKRDDTPGGIHGEFKRMRKAERWETKLKGCNQLICIFYQTKSCREGSKCKFAHVCMRCQTPGHGVTDLQICPVKPQ